MFIDQRSARGGWFGKTAAAAAVALMISGGPTRAAAPFEGFTGDWAGGGDIRMVDGSREKIRCRATYSVPPSGSALHITLNCASDSYKVLVRSNVVVDGEGNLSGSWREETRQAEGSVSGRVTGPGQLQASLEGTVYGIQLSVNTRGNQQAVAIRAQGTDVEAVDITMRRG